MTKRFFVNEILLPGALIEISDHNETRHIVKALRLKAGDTIFLSNGRGHNATAELVSVERRAVTAKVLTVEEHSTRGPSLTLWQGSLKSPRMDWLVEKAAELGVDRLVPLICEFSVAITDKKERWERIAKSALKQSGAGKLLAVDNPLKFSQLPAFNPAHDSLFVLSPDGGPISGLAPAIQKKNPGAADHIHLFVGPEGGFSPNELGCLSKSGALPCSLGKSILRGETAGLLAAGIVRHTIDFSSTKPL